MFRLRRSARSYPRRAFYSPRESVPVVRVGAEVEIVVRTGAALRIALRDGWSLAQEPAVAPVSAPKREEVSPVAEPVPDAQEPAAAPQMGPTTEDVLRSLLACSVREVASKLRTGRFDDVLDMLEKLEESGKRRKRALEAIRRRRA